MTKVFFRLLLLCFAFVQFGCAQSKKSCLNTDWNKRGYEDGIAGKPSNGILADQKACADKEVEIPILDYKKGWTRGVERYCSTDHAYKLGLENKKTNVKNCPIEFQLIFNRSYKKGRDYTETQKKIKELEKKKAEQSKEITNEIKELKEKK